MRILCTGGAGFLGSHLLERLTDEGHEVWGFDNFLTGRRENWEAKDLDITDRQTLYADANMIEPELVIHCAASYADPQKWHRDTDVNVAGAINVAAVAKHHGARIIYFQTSLPPISSYAISKIAGEHYLRLAGIPLAVYQLANIYGPRNLSGAIPAFYKRLAAGESCIVTDTTRNFVFVEDLVNEVVRDLEREGSFGICSAEDTSILELFLLMRTLMGERGTFERTERPKEDVGSLRPAYPSPPSWWWKRQVPLEEGLGRAIAWYSENGVEQAYTHLSLKG